MGLSVFVFYVQGIQLPGARDQSEQSVVIHITYIQVMYRDSQIQLHLTESLY